MNVNDLVYKIKYKIIYVCLSQIAQLNALIALLLGDLTPSDRQKIMTICTVDVHARDVVAKLLSQKVKPLVIVLNLGHYSESILNVV